MKVVRINTKLYGKAKSLEEGKRPPGSPTGSSTNNTMRYKTELCRPFQENGFCKYGDKCQFAHGEQDLRCLPRHPKYKTELCRTYHTRGFCPYGLRCHFIHSIEETRNMENSGLPPPKSPTKKTFTFSTPLSPSLDSGISSPDDYQRGKYFEFPGGDHSSSGSGSDSDYRDYDHTFDPNISTYVPSYPDNLTSPDPFLDLDANSIGSNSPSKPLPEEFPMDVYSMKELFTQMNLEDSTSSQERSSSCHRLPIFDDILNTRSDSALLEQNHSHSPPNPFGFFNA